MSAESNIQCFIIINSVEPRIRNELLNRLVQNGILLKNIDTLEFNFSDFEAIKEVVNGCIEDKVASISEISIDSY